VAWTEDGLGNLWDYDDADDQAEGTYHPIDGWRTGPVTILANSGSTVHLTGNGGVPDTGVQAVVVNVGVDRPDQGGNLELYPTSKFGPGVSTMTFPANEPRSTLHTVAVANDGGVMVMNNGNSAITVTFDVLGWYAEAGVPGGSVFVPLPTRRILDTRQSGAGGPLGPEETRELQVTGVGGVPDEGVTAVVYDIEGLQPSSDTYITAYSSDVTTRPGTRSLWLKDGRLADNLTITEVGSDGKIALYNRQGSMNIAIDVVGYFADPDLHDGNVFRPVTAQRLVDTRTTGGQWETPWKAGWRRPVAMVGVGTLPEQGVAAVVGEVQAVNPWADLGMWATPSGTTATGNTYLGQAGLSVGNHMYTGLGDNGAFDLHSSRTTDVVVDVFGYFTPLPRSVTVTDPRDDEGGHTLEYRYDGLGRLVGTIDQDGYEKARAYNEQGFLLATIDATGTWLAYTYDDEGHVTSEQTAQLEPDWTVRWSSTKRFGYAQSLNPEIDGKLAWVSDGRSADRNDTTYRTDYTYNAAGQPLKVIGPPTAASSTGVGVTDTYTTSSTPAVEGGSAVAPAGLLETTTDAAGLTTRYRYDTKGDLREIWYPPQPTGSGPPSRRDVFTYDALGRAITKTEYSTAFPDGTATTTEYDAVGRVVKETGPQLSNPVTGNYRAEVTRTYTDNGLPLRTTVADAATSEARWVENTYDDADRLTGTLDSAGRATTRTYDEAGNLASETAYDDTRLAYTYNGRGLVETVTAEDVVHDPIAPSAPVDVELAGYGYDAVGRRISEVDAGGRLVQNMWRPDGQLEATMATNVRNADPDTGLPAGGEHSVLGMGASLDPAGNPTEVYEASDISMSDGFDGPLGSGWIADGGSWSVTGGELRAGSSGVLRRTGGHDGSVSVVLGSGPPALPAFRGRTLNGENFSSYIQLAWDGTNLRIEQATAGSPLVLGQGKPAHPLTAGDRVEAVFLGDRAWALVNGVLVADAYIGDDLGESGYGVVCTAAGQGITSFRFDAFRQTTNTFDSYGRVTSSAFDPSGANVVTTTTRDAAGRPTRVEVAKGTNAPGLITHTGYDARGNVDWTDAEVEGGARRRTDATYDDRGLLTAVETPEHSRVEMSYDRVGQLVTTEEPSRSVVRYGEAAADVTPTTTYGYDAFGERTVLTDPAGRTTTFGFDDRGFPVLSTLPSYTPPGGTALTRTTAATYDDMGRVLSATDVADQTTNFTYNSLGQVVLRKDPAAGDDPRGEWRYLYDDLGRVVEEKDPLGAIDRPRWDDLDRQTGVEQIERYPSLTSNVGGFSYGNAGGLLRSRTPAGVVSTSTFDIAGRLLQSFDADGNVTTYAYDDLMRPNQVTGPDGRSVKTVFDMAGDKIREEFYGPGGGAALGSARYTWDQDHRLLTARSPRGVAENFATAYGYNAAGQIVSRATPVGPGPGESIVEGWKYDELGQPTSHTDGRLNETWQTYNSMGLPEDTIAPSAGAQTAVADRRWRTSYDAAGRPVTLSSPGGVSVTTTYDQLGRPTQQAGAGSGASTETRTFDWDQLGRMASASTPTSSQSFTYYDSGLLRSSSGTSGDSSFSYDADGRPTQQVDSSGTLDVSYDDRGLPSSMSSTLAGDVDFTYDTAGRPSTVDYGGNTRRTFAYDDWGRVDTDVLSTAGTATPLYGVDYGYDLDGNITSKAVTGTSVPAAGTNTYAYDQASRITSWTRPGSTVAEAYTWDGAGNRTGAGSGSAQYDAQNRLTSVSGPDGQTAYAWNADGTLDTQTTRRRVGLVVASPSSLTTAEGALQFVLVASGEMSVTLVDDNAAVPGTGIDVFAIAPTVDATALGTKYRDVAVPVVTLAAGTWQANDLTSAAPTSSSGTSAYVASAGHQVTAGKTGTVALLSSPDALSSVAASGLGAGATRVWATSSGSTDAVVAVYDKNGATATGTGTGIAAERRVMIGLSAGAVGKLNGDGWGVIAAAIAWADDNTTTTFGSTSFDFDAFEQLKTVTPPSPATASTYDYDALGRRRSAPTGPLTYPGMGIQPSSDGANRYGWGPGGTGVVAVDDMTSGGGLWAHADGHADMVGTFTPGATALASAQTFSPWGEPLGATGDPLPLGYQSERTDLPAGLVPMGARQYNPATATFISPDPAHDPTVPNPYSYTPANPLSFTDPTGERICFSWNGATFCWGNGGDGGDDVVTTGGKATGQLPKDPTQQKKKKNNTPDSPSPGTGPGGGSGSGSGSGGGSGNGTAPGSGSGPPRPTNCGGPCGGRPPGSAEAPPRPQSELEEQVKAGQPAIPNYPGRIQVDHSNGRAIDTGLSGRHGPSVTQVVVDDPSPPASPAHIEGVVVPIHMSDLPEILQECADVLTLHGCLEGSDNPWDTVKDLGAGLADPVVGAVRTIKAGLDCAGDRWKNLDFASIRGPGSCGPLYDGLAHLLTHPQEILNQCGSLEEGGARTAGCWITTIAAGAALKTAKAKPGATKGPDISGERPVVFDRMKGGQTAAQDAQMRAYVEGCNAALCDDALSPTGRVSTQGSLARQASRAAKAERAANPGAYGPGQHAGHVPDTTWTGNPHPHSWLALDGPVNNSLGAQAGQYLIGYQPTGFWFIDDYIAEFGATPPP
jgi:RHS repeat-associated protein